MFKAIVGIGQWLMEKAGLLPRHPRTTAYFQEKPVVHFRSFSRTWVRTVINNGRARNAQGGLDWSREEYIAYALARPVATREVHWMLPWGDNVLRTARFRRHEMFANDNINYGELARILWECELVTVNGVVCSDSQLDVPWGLVEFCEEMAPWLPKPPNEPRSIAA